MDEWISLALGPVRAGPYKGNIMESSTLRHMYKKWQSEATPEQIAFVDSVYALAEKNYDSGGDTIVEAMEPQEIVAEFKTLNDAKSYVGLRIEQELNARWGEDTDPQLERAARYEQEWN